MQKHDFPRTIALNITSDSWLSSSVTFPSST